MSIIFYVSYAMLWIFLAIQSILVVLLYRQFGLGSLSTVRGVQRDGLHIGAKASSFKGPDIHNNVVEWTQNPEKLSLLAFVSPTCGPCEKILPSFRQLAAASNDVEIVMIVNGPYVLVQELVERFRPPPSITCLSDEGNDIYEDYRVRAMPFVFIVGRDDRILAKGLCDTPERLQQLLANSGVDIAKKLLEPVLRVI